MNTKKTLVLLRHGQTDYNHLRRIQGISDIDLNATGRAQAEAAAKQLVRDFSFTHVFSSPLRRAYDTAQAVASRVDLPIQTDRGLMERNFGKWEGLHADQIVDSWPEEYALWRAGKDPAPTVGAETRLEVGDRLRRAVEGLTDPLPEGAVALIASHGSAICQGVIRLLDQDPTVWDALGVLDNCHWAVLVSSTRSTRWQLLSYNLGAPIEV